MQIPRLHIEFNLRGIRLKDKTFLLLSLLHVIRTRVCAGKEHSRKSGQIIYEIYAREAEIFKVSEKFVSYTSPFVGEILFYTKDSEKKF